MLQSGRRVKVPFQLFSPLEIPGSPGAETYMRHQNSKAALRRALFCFSLVALLGGCATVQRADEPSPRDGPPTALTARSPFEEPPGALSPAVNQANIATTICVAGWTTTVRPPTSYTQSVKRHMLAQVSAPASQASDYELDHFVPLALGCNPTSLENLWLQRWLGSWNARIKDRLERRLQVLVCEDKVSLAVARNAIRKGWKAAYAKYVDGGGAPREMEPDDDDEPLE